MSYQCFFMNFFIIRVFSPYYLWIIHPFVISTLGTTDMSLYNQHFQLLFPSCYSLLIFFSHSNAVKELLKYQDMNSLKIKILVVFLGCFYYYYYYYYYYYSLFLCRNHLFKFAFNYKYRKLTRIPRQTKRLGKLSCFGIRVFNNSF